MVNLNPLADIFWFIFRILALSALAVLVSVFMPRHIQTISADIVANPISAFGLGLLTIIVVPVLIIVMAITIILIPISLIGILVTFLAWLLGWLALGNEIGRRMAEMLKTEWAVPVSAGIGTLVLTLISSAVMRIPCVGWVVPFIIGVFGLGGVISSQFGTKINLPPASSKGTPAPAPVTPNRPIDLPGFTPPPAAPTNPIPPTWPNTPGEPPAPTQPDEPPAPDEPPQGREVA
jgi:hypothetical protein